MPRNRKPVRRKLDETPAGLALRALDEARTDLAEAYLYLTPAQIEEVTTLVDESACLLRSAHAS